MQCCWQEVPAARHQLRRMQLPSIVVARRHQLRRMPLARIVAARSCRLRGTSMLLASIVASMRAACMQCCWQEVPAARPQCMRFAPIAPGRSCRRRSSVACRVHPGWLDVPAGGGASAHAGCSYRCWQEVPAARHQLRRMPLASIGASMHAACRHCCWQEVPAARHQRMRFAPTVFGRSCRRLISVACRLHPVVLAVATACEA